MAPQLGSGAPLPHPPQHLALDSPRSPGGTGQEPQDQLKARGHETGHSFPICRGEAQDTPGPQPLQGPGNPLPLPHLPSAAMGTMQAKEQQLVINMHEWAVVAAPPQVHLGHLSELIEGGHCPCDPSSWAPFSHSSAWPWFKVAEWRVLFYSTKAP